MHRSDVNERGRLSESYELNWPVTNTQDESLLGAVAEGTWELDGFRFRVGFKEVK
jgi:hypothetical protein